MSLPNESLIKFRNTNCPNLSFDNPELFFKLVEELSKTKAHKSNIVEVKGRYMIRRLVD